jgi:hypothetical protein
MAVFSIRRFAIKQLMKVGDDGIMKMPSDMKADFAEAMLTKQLIDAGIDPRTIKNEQQMINVLDAIDNAKKAEQVTSTPKKVTSNVVDMKGKKLDTSKPIIGGSQEGGLDSIFNEMYGDFQKDKLKYMRGDDKPPPGSRGGKDDIAAPVQSAEETLKNMTEAELREKLIRENKEAVARIKNKKLIDDAIDNVSIGFSGDRRTDAELVAQEIAERRGLNIDDLDTRQRASIYGEAYEALTKKKFDPDNNMAQGGRVGLKDGMDRRTFMKVMAGLASIPILGKFFKGAKVASKTAPKVAMESATRSEPPTYFLKLVDKITKQGRPTTSTEDIMETYIYKGKNGDEYELVNDLKTGDLRITKDKTGVGTYGDKSFDTIEDRTIMEYKAERQDVDVETGRGTREAPEYEEYKIEFDADGTEAGAEAIEETVQKEIIEESAEEAPSIKKADGGRVGLLSGGGILRAILTNLAKDKGISPSEYLRLTNYKALPNEAKRIMSKDEFLKLKSDMTEKRIELMDTVKNMIVTRQNFEKSKADLAAGMNKASPGYGDKTVQMMFPEKLFPSPVPAGSGQKDVMMMEQLIKNLKTKDRQLNASGGVAYMLGE